MSKKGIIKTGVVVESRPGTHFDVEIDGKVILCYMSGRMYKNHIRVVRGDRVEVELSPVGDRGRIFRRI